MSWLQTTGFVVVPVDWEVADVATVVTGGIDPVFGNEGIFTLVAGAVKPPEVVMSLDAVDGGIVVVPFLPTTTV